MLKNNILFKIFNIDNFDTDTIKNCSYLELNEDGLESIKINKSGFEKINEYLKCWKYSFEELLYFISLRGYNGRNNFNIIEKSLEIVIKKNKKQIFLDLEGTKIDESIFEKVSAELYENFINIKIITNAILHNIVVFIGRSRSLYNDYKNTYYSFEVLMLILFKEFKNDFEKWFLMSKNKYLKLMFISKCFNWWLSNIDWLLNINNIKSKIPLVRIINTMMYFKIDNRWLPANFLPDNNLKFENILKYRSISHQDKIIYLLYYIDKNFRIVNYENIDKEKQKIKELNILLNKFKNVIQNITKEVIDDHRYVDSYILYLIISKLKDKDKMKNLYEYLIENRLKKNIKLIESETWNFSRVLESNVYGVILKKIKDTKLIEEIENNFEYLCEKTCLPYFYYINNELWSSNISKMLYYLIVIFIFYNGKDRKKIKKYKNTFLQVKKGFRHFFDVKQYNQLSVMKQILDQIVC